MAALLHPVVLSSCSVHRPVEAYTPTREGTHGRVPAARHCDADASLRDARTSLLRAVSWRAEGVAAAGAFVPLWQGHTTGCLLLDVRLPGVSDVEHQRQLGRDRAHLPGMFMVVRGHEAWRAPALQAGDPDLRQLLHGHCGAGNSSCGSCTSVGWHMGLHCWSGVLPTSTGALDGCRQ
jgi:hypothetical protein